MKKKLFCLLCLLLTLLLAAFAGGCAPKEPETLSIMALKGPTGMGMAPLMEAEYEKQYGIVLSSAPDDVTAAFISGEAQLAAVPINLAAVLYQKLQGDVELLAVNTLGVRYVLENGESVKTMADLAGKTLYATGQGSTPEYILNYLLEKNGLSDVTVEYCAEHSELAALLASGEAALGMLPEPNVTAAKSKNPDLRVALDLTEEWNKVSDAQLVQGCLIARRSFVEENQKAVEKFLVDYAAAAALISGHHEKGAVLIASHEILASAEIAKQAISRCNIVCITGEEMRAAAEGMLSVLYAANPKSVGGALPGEDFYGAK